MIPYSNIDALLYEMESCGRHACASHARTSCSCRRVVKMKVRVYCNDERLIDVCLTLVTAASETARSMRDAFAWVVQ